MNVVIIKGPIVHTCGWESDGGAFSVGAGCPKCGERIAADSVQALPSELLLSEVHERRRAEAVPVVGRDEAAEIELKALPPVGDPEWLASVTVAEAAAHVSGIETIPELSAFLAMETAGKNRKGVLAAIDAHGTELATASLAEGPSS